MVDLVKWSLVISYYLGRFSGVLNFEIDLKTGRTRVTKRATISAAVSHVFLIIILCFTMKRSGFVIQGWLNTNAFQDTCLFFMAIVRIICVLLSLASRWSQRRTFMTLFRLIYRLCRRNPDTIRCCRRSIVNKCFCAIMAESLQFILILVLIPNHLNMPMALSICSLSCLKFIINVIISQYFTAMAIIRGRYTLLNKKLLSVIAEIQSLIPNKGGVFMTKCCHLADILEKMARTQSNLQALTERISRTYRFQILGMIITYYLSFVEIFYFMFTAKKYKFTTNSPAIAVVASITSLTFYLIDCWLNAFNVFYLIDSHHEMVKLLSQRTIFHPGLDQRLETVFESFILNLARNPFRLSFFGLFEINRRLWIHSVLLIQYDVEHF
ncbi:hypothetical protein KR084_006175 [Drosophila pseudotakahashii]|nr:hypothetical protein KR084_006175 [Drosophila pseudotakahashii]